MMKLKDHPVSTVWQPLPDTLSTGAAADALLSNSQQESRREAWRNLIDHTLLNWAQGDNRPADDDEVTMPSEPAVSVSIQVAMQLRDRTPPVPVARVIPDGVGGVIFRWGTPGDTLVTLEIDAKGRAEFILTENLQIIARSRCN